MNSINKSKIIRNMRYNQLQCSLCDFTFSSQDCGTNCIGCPISFSCEILKCPNCGYTFPSPETSTGRFLKRLFNKIRRKMN